MLRRLLVCLAFATWCFLNTWVELAEGESAYSSRYDPLYAVVIPVVYWELLLTLLMFGAWEFCRTRTFERALPLHAIFLGSCFVPLGIASIAALRVSPFNFIPIVRKPAFWPIVFLLGILPLGFAASRPRTASRFMRQMFLYSWPVLAIVFVQGGRRTLLRYPREAYVDGPLAKPFNSTAPRVRVVWIIFDELSQTIAFRDRPDSLHLPNFDHLKAESFYASSAEPPARSTIASISGLILGERVEEAFPDSPNDILVRTRSRSHPFPVNSVPNLFDTARQHGLNTALVGSSLPYGRILNRSLTKCYWTAGWLASGVEERFQPQSLLRSMRDRANFQFAALPLVGHLPGVFPGIYPREEKRRTFSYLLDRARQIVADPSTGLALIHLPVPHPPAIQNRIHGAMTGERRIGYLDGVALADDTLGALRQAIEQAGLWDRTALLVSADHGWRTYIWRGGPEWTDDEEVAARNDTSGIPFLLRLPGQTSGVFYSKPFNTIITRQVIMDILGERLTDLTMIPALIERSAAAARLPGPIPAERLNN